MTQEKATPERMFTDEQIAQVKAKLKTDPKLLKDLILSAQGGNQTDLQFLSEVDLDELGIFGLDKKGGEFGLISSSGNL